MTTAELEILAQKIVITLNENPKVMKRLGYFMAESYLDKKKENLPEKVSKNIAYKHFGRKMVDEWVLLGLIEIEPRGNRLLLKTKRLRELERISQISYLYEKEKEKCLNSLII